MTSHGRGHRGDVRGERQHLVDAGQPGRRGVRPGVQDAVNSVLNGEASPDESLAGAQEEAQAALDRAGRTSRDVRGAAPDGAPRRGPAPSTALPRLRGAAGAQRKASAATPAPRCSSSARGSSGSSSSPRGRSSTASTCRSPTTTSSTPRVRRARQLRRASDPKVQLALGNTAFFTLVQVSLYVIVSFALALLLDRAGGAPASSARCSSCRR